MRVALLSYGFEEYCIQQANGLARECEVLLILPREESVEHAASLDPAVEFFPFTKPRLRQPVRQLMLNAALLRRIRQFQPDVIHMQQGHMWFNLALPLLRKCPLVVTVHDPRHHVGDRDSQRTPQWLMDSGFKCADRAIVHGELLKRQVMDLFGKRSDKVHVIPHIAIGAPSEANHAGVDDGRTVLFFGRLWEYKGLKYLIEAEPLIREAMPGVRIVIAGAGEDFERYRQMMARPESFVVHNRHISASECDQLFREASIVVLPYIEATQSGVVPLAYSASKPVVATRVGALAEVVENGVTGRLVPPQDPAALAAAIVALLDDSDTRLRMGQAARQKLDAEWSPAVVGRQALEVYRRAVEDRAGSRVAAARGERLALEVQESHL